MIQQASISVGLAQYPISFFSRIEQYQEKLRWWVSEAAIEDTELLLFPEYGSMELSSLLPLELRNDLQAQLEGMQQFLAIFTKSHQQLAAEFKQTIIASSFPLKTEIKGRTCFVNRCFVFHPDGRVDHQDKQIMTRFEREQWSISSGQEIKVIDTAVGKIGICICYDSEFPLIARTQIELGAELILVPSVTDTMAGFNRVRIGSQARALENQCYVLHAPLVGEADWSAAVDVNRGAAAIYTPVDHGFPEDGILIQGKIDHPEWVLASLDMLKLDDVRKNGQVLNHRDWAYQFNDDQS